MLQKRSIALQDRECLLHFDIHEMPASRMEDWLYNMADATGQDAGFPTSTTDAMENPGPLEALLRGWGVTLLAGLEYDKAKPLLDQMLECCWRTDLEPPVRMCAANVDEHIEDMHTLQALRRAALKLNLGFFRRGRRGERREVDYPRWHAYQAAMDQYKGLAIPENISPGMALLLRRGTATLRDLETEYSCGDMLDMIEALEIEHYNNWCVTEDRKHERSK